MLQEVHLQHVEGAVDVGGLPENQRPQATRKLHAAMASCWERRGGGVLSVRQSLKKLSQRRHVSAFPLQEPWQPGKTEGQLPAPPFASPATWHVSTIRSFCFLPSPFSLSFFLHLTITFFIYAMVFCLIGLGSFFRSFVHVFIPVCINSLVLSCFLYFVRSFSFCDYMSFCT